jgi:prepilin-type N-terminal cleavage/methylation domain-containing protein
MTTTVLARSLDILRAKSRGFTLTEIAIVLGIIGIILGAIWAAAAMVYENNRTKQAEQETLGVINNWKSIFGSRQVDITNGNDMTQATVNNTFESSEMLSSASGACAVGGTSTGCFMAGPWSGSEVTVTSASTNNAVTVTFKNLSESACNRYANSVTNAAGLIQMQISGGSTVSFPPLGTTALYTTSSISGLCTTANNGNSVAATFSMN